jgi:hypothetical protein
MKILGLKWRRGLIGAYNGKRITGFEVEFALLWDMWQWKPLVPIYTNSILWLCFKLRFAWRYGDFLLRRAVKPYDNN